MNDNYKEKSNPVFNTAKMTLYWLARSGNEAAELYFHKLGFDQEIKTENIPAYDELADVSTFVQEMRYKIVNQMIDSSGYKNILDLACGYSPRALEMCPKNYTYIGGDLPSVVEQITETAKECAGAQNGKRITYMSLDVTDKNSMFEAEKELNGSVCIVTEGLMMYLQEFERIELCRNIRSILKKHGGCWITPDFSSIEFVKVVYGMIFKERTMEMMLLSAKAYSQASDSDFKTTPIVEKDVIDLFTSCGLTIEYIPFPIDEIEFKSINLFSEEIQQQIKIGLKQLHGLKFTVDETFLDEPVNQNISSDHFKMNSRNQNGVLEIQLSGRLDSVSAPQMLEEYKIETDTKTVQEVVFDMNQLEYISSAGLRVLLMIYKRTDGHHVTLNGVTPSVLSILNQTGYDEFFIINEKN